jgi:hypothetical protein
VDEKWPGTKSRWRIKYQAAYYRKFINLLQEADSDQEQVAQIARESALKESERAQYIA